MIELEGVLHDGETSRARGATLRVLRDATVVLFVGAEEWRLTLADLDVPARLGDTVRRIRLPSGAVFETTDNDGADAIVREHLGGGGLGGGLIHGLERQRTAVLVAAALMLAAGALFVWQGIPALARQAAFTLPAETSEAIDRGTLDVLDEIMDESELLEADRERLRTRFAEIVADAPEGHTFELVFRRGGRFGANAFALPSGTVVLTDELVDLAEHEDEIVGVLAHEVGHVVHRHGLRDAIQQSAVAGLVLLVTGDLSSTTGFVAAVPMLLVDARYSREFEREADDHAAAVLEAHDISADHFATMLERLGGEGEGEADGDGARDADGVDFTSYLGSHPAPSERIERLRRSR